MKTKLDLLIQKEVSKEINNKVKKLTAYIDKKFEEIKRELIGSKDSKKTLPYVVKKICNQEQANGHKKPQEYIANKLNINYQHLSNIKNGRVKTCSFNMAKNIYKNYGYTVEPYKKEDLI